MQTLRTGFGTFFTYLAVAAFLSLSTEPAHAKKEVRLDHPTQTIAPSGTIALYPDELLALTVAGTSRECYTFNLKALEPPAADQQGAAAAPIEWEDVPIPVIHHRGVNAYEVEVRKRTDLTDDRRRLCTLPDHTFRVPVETYEWGLALAGAFTGDKLTDPVFFLDDGVENPDAPPEMQRQGFFILRDKKAQDSYSLGAAAMVHVFHDDPYRFDFKSGDSTTQTTTTSGAGLVHWAPISFGLGVGQEAEARYFLGTSLRFGQKAYLTAGWAFGSMARLPNGLREGGFTTESNALGSLGSRTGSAFFLSLSFDFLKVGASSFLGAFETAKPQPPKGEDQNQQAANEPPKTATNEEIVLAALNATDMTDRFRDDGIFKSGFDGRRFCSIEIAPESRVTSARVNRGSLAGQEVLTGEQEKKIKTAVAELVAANSEEKEASDVLVSVEVVPDCSGP